jgi:hypothetical protein
MGLEAVFYKYSGPTDLRTIVRALKSIAWYYDHQPAMDAEIKPQAERLRVLRATANSSSSQHCLAAAREKG